MINFRVTLTDNSVHEVRVLPIDIRLAEKKFGKSVSEMDKSPSMDETGFLIFNAMKREGRTTAENLDAFFEVWADADRIAAPKVTTPGVQAGS